jgi:hypothetical protein
MRRIVLPLLIRPRRIDHDDAVGATARERRGLFANLCCLLDDLEPPIDVIGAACAIHVREQLAEALGWTSADLFGLHTPPAKPHPSYNRLSRYDQVGLCWLLQGRRVTAFTESTAAIENPATGSITTYRKHNKPSYGPLGDSLDDFK